MISLFSKMFSAKVLWIGVSLICLLWLINARRLAAEQKDPFADESNTQATKTDSADPLAPAEQGKEEPESVKATRKGKPTPFDRRIDFEISVTPKQARRGETVQLTIKGMPKPGFHTYPMTQRADPAQEPSQLSTLTYGEMTGLQPLWPIFESNPQTKFEERAGWFLEHTEPFTWKQDILILPDAAPGQKNLLLTIKGQVCDAKGCVPGQPQFEVKIDVSAAAPVPLTPVLEKRQKDKQPELLVVTLVGAAPPQEPVPVPGNPPQGIPRAAANSAPNAAAAVPKGDATGLIAFILQGIFWGYFSLLTPCVFPMIPITVSFFLKQSEKEHHKPLRMALVYSGTIVVVLTIGAVLLLHFFQELSQYWSTNLVLGALFLFFALSLFGMYEIRLPTSLANFTSARESRGGLIGTIFMALTFTIISFACVAPFLGGFAGISVQARPWYEIVLGGLAYSVTFAAPFILLALFPTLLRQLPKSGSWMNAMKVVMGFLELAAALKFLRAAELLRFGKAEFLTYDLVLGIYVALAILCGLYLLNLYRLPHDHEAPDHLGVLRLLFSLGFLSLGIYLMPGLFKQATGEPQRPAGSVFAWLDAFLLPETPETADPSMPAAGNGSTVGQSKDASHLAWIGNFDRGLQIARDQGKLVFLDFTGLT